MSLFDWKTYLHKCRESEEADKRRLLDNLGLHVDVAEANRIYATEKNLDVDTLTEQQKKQAYVNACQRQAYDKR